MRLIVFLALLVPTVTLSQQDQLPAPKPGWDWFRSQVRYPELLLRAGVRSALMFTIRVDSVGSIQEISFEALTGSININGINYGCQLSSADSLFNEEISRVCRSCEWIPGVRKGRCATMSVDVPVVFILHRAGEPEYNGRLIVKDAQLPRIDTVRYH